MMENGNRIKTNPDPRLFAYALTILDLGTNLHVAYGVSMKSEKDVHREALRTLSITKMDVEGIRLDQYYCPQFTFDDFPESAKVFVLPRNNKTIRGPPAWKELIGRLLDMPMEFMSEYYRRGKSELHLC